MAYFFPRPVLTGHPAVRRRHGLARLGPSPVLKAVDPYEDLVGTRQAPPTPKAVTGAAPRLVVAGLIALLLLDLALVALALLFGPGR
jgi:hypothetical protein